MFNFKIMENTNEREEMDALDSDSDWYFYSHRWNIGGNSISDECVIHHILSVCSYWDTLQKNSLQRESNRVTMVLTFIMR